MSTWQGVSHARMTRSMQSLSGGSYKVLAAVRRIIPDGARRKISQAEIAKKARVSEGTVSSALRSMDGIYLVRHFVGTGRGNGYEIEVLLPHEQRPVGALTAPQKGSKFDPCNRSFSDGIATPQTCPPEGSNSEPSILLLHAHEQQQQTGSPPEAAAPPEQAAQLAPETVAALEAVGAHPKVIQRVAAANPSCTPAQVAEMLEMANAKPNAHPPPASCSIASCATRKLYCRGRAPSRLASRSRLNSPGRSGPRPRRPRRPKPICSTRPRRRGAIPPLRSRSRRPSTCLP